MGSVSPFSAADLDANRRGVLSDGQRRHWRRYARRRRVGVLRVAFFTACGAVGLFVFRGSASRPGELIAGIAGLGAVTVILVLVAALGGGGAWMLDARDGRVSIAEGALLKDREDTENRTQFVHVGGLRLKIGQSGYDAAPSAGFVRAYYLPRSKLIVNLERLPDRPLPDEPGALRKLMKDSIVNRRSRDRNAAAEAAADLNAFQEAIRAASPPPPVPPPARQRDPRPLAQALIGVWSNVLMTVEFSADGIVTMSAGPVRAGRWAVDREDRLVADWGTGTATAEAWVSRDGLTIVFGTGEAMTFRRVPAP